MTLHHRFVQFIGELRQNSPGVNLRRAVKPWQQAAIWSSLQTLENRCLLSAISENMFNGAHTSSIGVGPSPRTIAINDFDGDNIADIAIANAGDATVSVLRGLGEGSFGPETRYTLPSYAYGLVAADFDGDHKIDLMTANTGARNISILKGNGDGTFQSELVVGNTAGQEGNRLIAADFNEDGKLDLAAPTWDGYVAVLIGNGNGTFGATSLYYSGGLVNCSDIVTGDFDGDHKLDLATANVYGQGVSVFKGNGDGTFFVSESYSLGGYTSSLISGDFDHDGDLDIAAPSYNLNRVGVLHGNADGTFSAPSYYSVGAAPFYVAVADFNGDDNLDLVVAAYSGDAVSVLGGNGDGSFQPTVNFAAGINPLGVEVSDFDGNGTADIVVSNFNSGALSVLLNLSELPNNAPIANAGGPYVIDEGDSLTLNATDSSDADLDMLIYSWDVNGDGTFGDATGVNPVLDDIQLAGLGIDGRMAGYNVYLQVDDGHGHVVTSDAATLNVVNVAPVITGTIDGLTVASVGQSLSYSVAGFTDVGTLDTHTTTWQMLNSEGQIIVSGTGLNFDFTPNTAGTFTVTFMVMDDDGGSDLKSRTITIPSFQVPAQYGTDATSGSLVSGDFNGDNVIDVAATAGSRVNVFLGIGDGTFADPLLFPLSSGAQGSDIITADLTGDGILDFAVATYGARTVDVLKGNSDGHGHGNGTFSFLQSIYLGINNSGIAAGDFDKDGDIDLASCGRGPNPSGFDAVGIIRNDEIDGNTVFTFNGWAFAGGWPVELVAGDFNHDDIIDLAAADYLSHTVSILQSNGNLTFTKIASLSTPGDLSDVTAGDIDSDGHLDLVATNIGDLSPGDAISVFYGIGTGQFTTGVNYSTSDRPTRTTIGDVNGDNSPDILVATYNGQSIDIFLGDGHRTFSPKTSISSGPGASVIAIDVDSNGMNDLVSANNHSGNFGMISVFLNLSDPPNTAPGFTTGLDIVVEEGPTPQSFTAWAADISAGPQHESQQVVTFVVTLNSNPTLFTSAPQIAADGTLTFQAAPGASGIAIIAVQLTDDGGTENGGSDTSPQQSFQIIVLPSVVDADLTSNEVFENAGPGTTVGIAASAGLLGPFNSVSHVLENNEGKPFAIDATTGVITVAGPLDFETNGSYSIDVVSSRTDSSTLSFLSRSTFVVSILDVQEGIIIPGGPGDDTFKFWPGPAAGQFYFKWNAEPNVLITPTDIVTIVGGGGADTLIIEGTNGVNEFEIHSNRIQFNGIDFFDNQITTRQINALGSGDTISVYGGVATVNGGSAADTLVAMAARHHVWTFNGPNAGNLNGEVFFSSMERMLGGPLDDVFRFESTGSVTSTIDGGSGSDTLDYSDVITPVSIHLQSGTATRTGGTSNLEEFLGGSDTDTLTGSNTVNLWTLAGIGTGNLNGTHGFSGFENLTGGNVADSFVLGSGRQITGNLSGGGGADLVEYQTSDAVVINLATSTASLIGGTFLSIQQFQLGGGSDTVVGRNVNSNWTVTGPGSVTTAGIGFTNVEQLVGGTGTDSLTGLAQTNLWSLTGSDSGTLSGLAWTEIENLYGGNQADTFVVQAAGSASGTVSGGGGVDVLDYTLYGSSMTIDFSTASGTGISHFTSIATIHGSAEIDSIVGASNGNTWTIMATGGTVDGVSFASIEQWYGGSATDTLVGRDLETAWLVTGANSGSVYDVIFAGMENLTGASRIDTFAIQGGGSISGTINGGASVDVLDFSAASGAVTVNLANNSASTVGTFSSIGMLLGSAWNDVLVGTNNSNIWAITSPTAGTVANYSFSEFESLLGGTGVDTFRAAESVTYLGSVDGGAGIDKLDYAAFILAVTANLTTGVATGFTGMTNVENLTGGDGNDTLVGNAADNVISGGIGDDIVCGLAGNDLLSGNNGRDLLIGGTGSDSVHGNNTEDILLGGTTIYTEEATGVVDQPALDGLMLEWRRDDATYAQRMAHLNGTNSGGLNGSYLLNTSTVLDDLTIDDLFGEGGLDWCLFGTGDVVHS